MNCKPGDLAIVVRSDTFPENIGILVEVLTPWVWNRTDTPFSWHVQSLGRPLAAWDGYDNKSYTDKCGMYDRSLRPIRPLDLTEIEITTLMENIIA